MKHENEEPISRRGFLKGAATIGALGAVGGLAGCSNATTAKNSGSASSASEARQPADDGVKTIKYIWEMKPETPTDIKDTIDCDIVVVGGGIAGCCGALKAADAGYDVHILEKSNAVGLSRELSFSFNCKMQKDAGIIFPRAMRDSTFSTYYNVHSTDSGCASVIQDNHWQIAQFLDTSGPWMDWLAPLLIEQGIDVHPACIPGEYETIPFAISYGAAGNPPSDWQSAMQKAIEAKGGIIDFGTAGYMLVQDDNGKVTGIIAKNEDGYVQYNTRLGVLLAAGGISNDKDMMQAFFWGNERIIKHFAYPSHTGDAHKMALWAGASMDEIFWGDPFTTSIKTDVHVTRVGSTTDYHGFDDTWPACPGVGQLGMLWLDIRGRRFTNEMGDLIVGTTAMLNQEKGQCWSLWDSAWQKKVGHLIPKGDQACWSKFVTWFATNTQEQIDEDVKNGVTLKCDTLEEVAERTGMDYDTMMENIELYNQYCAAGYDADQLKDPNWLAAVDTPPYYVAGMGMAECVTRGGVHVDRHSRVINKEGYVVPGLWAAGTCAGGCFGFQRMFGSVPIGQNSAWRAVCDMIGEELPKTEWA